MSVIVTLTFNPCIDKSIELSKLIPEKKMHCPAIRYDPGGGGINVARGIKRLGGDVTAIFPSGGYHGELLIDMLHNKEQVPIIPIAIKNNTRENWMIFENLTKKQYRFVMTGPVLDEKEWQECLAKLDSVNDVEFIVISGSMPPDFPKNIFEKIKAIAVKKKAKVIVDLSGEALKLALMQGVYIVKPNFNELASLIVAFNLSNESVAKAAKEIVERKFAKIVIVSMGSAGAIIADANTTIEIKSPPVKKIGTVGAGDNMVAGILYELSNKKTIREATEFGVACGAAATMNPGTELFHPNEVGNLHAVMQKEFVDYLK